MTCKVNQNLRKPVYTLTGLWLCLSVFLAIIDENQPRGRDYIKVEQMAEIHLDNFIKFIAEKVDFFKIPFNSLRGLCFYSPNLGSLGVVCNGVLSATASQFTCFL